MELNARIYVAGMNTLLGSALVRVLRQHGYTDLLGTTEREPDLTDGAAVDEFFARTRPEYVFMAGGPSGGIEANLRYPATLIRDNILAETHVIHTAYRFGATKLLYLASSCCYPRVCPQPMRVESLMTGRLESSNEAYAIAKLAGIGLCQAYAKEHGARFISGIPADAFGPEDDFSPEDSHVVPALIRRMHEAKIAGTPTVDIWGTGRPQREFVYVDDVAEEGLFVMLRYERTEPINLGGGTPLSTGEVAAVIKEVVEYPGALRFDVSRPDGMPVKLLDSSVLLALGWRPKTHLREALQMTYAWYLREHERRVTPMGVHLLS
jgi:GDP-L-fucose synthase